MARKLVYWDSNAFLGLINSSHEPENAVKCEAVWLAAEQGLVNIVTSTLTISEVIYTKGKKKLDPAKRNNVSNFFKASHILVRPLTREIAERSRDVVWDTPIKPKDAIHVATAAHFKIPELHTLDSGLLSQGNVQIDSFTVSLKEPGSDYQLAAPLKEEE